MTTSITDRMPPVAVEYDSRGKRVTKHFEDANEAKRFYTAKAKEGKNPTVVGEQPTTEPATPPTQEAAAETKPAAPKTPGVTLARTRPYLAGQIIRRHGLAAGVTPEMVAELDEAYGKANPKESEFCLRNSWHTARGYTEAATE